MLRSHLRKIDGDLGYIIKEMDQEKYMQLEIDLGISFEMYRKCKTLFEKENIEAFKENKKFRLKQLED